MKSHDAVSTAVHEPASGGIGVCLLSIQSAQRHETRLCSLPRWRRFPHLASVDAQSAAYSISPPTPNVITCSTSHHDTTSDFTGISMIPIAHHPLSNHGHPIDPTYPPCPLHPPLDPLPIPAHITAMPTTRPAPTLALFLFIEPTCF
jgi:hypothetical protein